jgi:hypothetical protein
MCATGAFLHRASGGTHEGGLPATRRLAARGWATSSCTARSNFSTLVTSRRPYCLRVPMPEAPMVVPRPSIGLPTSLRVAGGQCGFPVRQAAAVGGSHGWCGWQAATGHRPITASGGLISRELVPSQAQLAITDEVIARSRSKRRHVRRWRKQTPSPGEGDGF